MGIIKKLDKNLISYIVGIAILLFLFIFLITCTQIGFGVKEKCKLAQEKYGGECVEALMKLIDDDSTQYGKNSAIWALGQLGDSRALPILEKYYTGQLSSQREKWNEGISQYELSKAIKLLRGGLNISAFIWRGEF
ncbi:MAG: hypothetical protein PHV78_01395 [Patescibacteria group bacterium]|nr:hypothetical protein [Patescibacteria group bacterium]MDD5121190.1 hypothetical protein [Patescibacteria group bacterium]MDD5222002.1 hypothetical protein [Patescibacteria group bacterium]MDD5395891.1 hypothetical protein [Patescibacteria group bacterium]